MIGILVQAPRTHFGIAELSLDDMKHMLDFGANFQLRPVASPLSLG